MFAPSEHWLAESPMFIFFAEMGALLATHHMAASMLVGRMAKNTQETEGQEVDLQVEVDL